MGTGKAEDFKLREVSLEFAYADADQNTHGYNVTAHKIPADGSRSITIVMAIATGLTVMLFWVRSCRDVSAMNCFFDPVKL